jgi:predicted MPP superfamily phosphohydrolase
MHLIQYSLAALIFVASIVLFCFLYFILCMECLLRKNNKKPIGKRLKLTMIVGHSLAGIGILCFLYGLLIEPYWLQTTFVEIKTPKLIDTTFRIVHFSDTHCDPRVRLEEKLPDIIQALKPDAIVFTGDTINSRAGLDNFQTMMRQMEAPLGKFAITGNWDVNFWNGIDLFEKTGFWNMTSNHISLDKSGESIVIAGLSFEKGPESQQVVSKLKQDDYNVFLYHNTDLIDYFGDKPVDLYLCGHTHGGQVALPFYGALMTLSRHGKKYESGFYKAGNMDLYISRGIGMEGGKAPRVRFWARPEITVFDIGPE